MKKRSLQWFIIYNNLRFPMIDGKQKRNISKESFHKLARKDGRKEQCNTQSVCECSCVMCRKGYFCLSYNILLICSCLSLNLFGETTVSFFFAHTCPNVSSIFLVQPPRFDFSSSFTIEETSVNSVL